MNKQQIILFRKLFRLSDAEFSHCLDRLLYMAFGKLFIDTIELDNILHARHGEYENIGKSMRDVVLENYGPEAVTLIETSINNINLLTYE